jgi:hypothetical protein
MHKKVLPLILLLASTMSFANTDTDPSENSFNYLEAGLGSVKIDGVGNGLYLSLGGSGTFNNFIIGGHFSVDLQSGGEAKASALKIGHYWDLNDTTDLVISYNSSNLGLSIDGGASGESKEQSIKFGFLSLLSDTTSANVDISVPLNGGGIGIDFGGNYWLNESTAIHVGHTVATGGGNTLLTFRFTL